jgi:hypothetical protein
MRRFVLLLIVIAALAALAAPVAASAQSSPFGPIPQAAEPTPTPTAVSNTADQSSVSRPLLLGIAGGVAIIFFGIGVYITRDARAHLTDADRARIDGMPMRTDAERKRAHDAKQKARVKGKAQRQARKAHRKR